MRDIVIDVSFRVPEFLALTHGSQRECYTPCHGSSLCKCNRLSI